MRHVIYLLLVANLVFFGWQMLQSQKAEVVRALPAIPVTATPLVTLQEMEQEQRQEQAPAPAPAPESETKPESNSEPNPVSNPVSNPEPPVEQGLADPFAELAMVESLTELQPPGGGGAITCRTLGPIMAVAQLRSLGSRLDAMGLEPRHRTSEIQEATGYWVYLPAMRYAEAQQVKSRLDVEGDTDYYIGKGNFISLGTFKEQSRADLRMRQARKLDLDPVLEPRYEIQTVHWLDVDRQTSNAVDLGIIMQDYPGIRLHEQACY